MNRRAPSKPIASFFSRPALEQTAIYLLPFESRNMVPPLFRVEGKGRSRGFDVEKEQRS